jgi:hypothetical protein
MPYLKGSMQSSQVGHELVAILTRPAPSDVGTFAFWHKYKCACGRVGLDHTSRIAAENMHAVHGRAARAKESEEASAAAVIA